MFRLLYKKIQLQKHLKNGRISKSINDETSKSMYKNMEHGRQECKKGRFTYNIRSLTSSITSTEPRIEISSAGDEVVAIRVVIAGENLHSILLDNESTKKRSIRRDIDRIRRSNPYIFALTPHCFTKGAKVLCGQATLLMKIGKEPQAYQGQMNFNIVKGKFVYDEWTTCSEADEHNIFYPTFACEIFHQ